MILSTELSFLGRMVALWAYHTRGMPFFLSFAPSLRESQTYHRNDWIYEFKAKYGLK
jgi:hypothetical protein